MPECGVTGSHAPSSGVPHGLHAALVARLGAVRRVVPVGGGGSTFLVDADPAMVVKRIRPDRTATSVARLFAALAEAGIRSPIWSDHLTLDGDEYALLDYLPGNPPMPRDGSWESAWEEAYSLLPRLAATPARIAPWLIEAEWLARLRGAELSSAARELLTALEARGPSGTATLAHGDFAPQNFLRTSNGLVLLDWEEAGTASPGFDAGWVQALNRIGAGPRAAGRALRQRLLATGITADELWWGEGLGLLRMHWRLLQRPSPAHAALQARVVQAIETRLSSLPYSRTSTPPVPAVRPSLAALQG